MMDSKQLVCFYFLLEIQKGVIRNVMDYKEGKAKRNGVDLPVFKVPPPSL